MPSKVDIFLANKKWNCLRRVLEVVFEYDIIVPFCYLIKYRQNINA